MDTAAIILRWVKRAFMQCAGVALLVIPAAILGFADELCDYFIGYRLYFGYNRESLINGIAYFLVTLSLATFTSLATIACSCKHKAAGTRFFQLSNPFASRPFIIVTAGALIALLFAFIFGYLALGASSPAVSLTNVQHVHQQFTDLTRRHLPHDEPLQAFSNSGFAVSTYEVRTVPRPSANAPNSWIWQAGKFEEYGFPMHCLRSPIDIGIPRPNLYRLFFDRQEDHFIWKQLMHVQLLPLEFAINAAVFAAALWLVCSGPGFIHRALRQRRFTRYGRCLNCGYILHGLPRCPECGHAAAAQKTTPA